MVPVTVVSILLALSTLTESYAGISDEHHLYHALHHFEVLHKNHLTHATRPEGQYRHIHFNTLGREFHLLLKPRKDSRRKDFQAIVIGDGGSREAIDVNMDHHLTGTLADDPLSTVHAHFDHTEGLLSAAILTDVDHYYIEPSHRHFLSLHDFHMISYRGSDIKYNLTGDPNHHFCGVNHTQHPYQQPRDNSFSKTGHSMEESHSNSGNARLKRQTSGQNLLCPLSLVATHNFHRHFSTGGNIRNSINFIISVVDMADSQIFRVSQWSEDIGERGFSFNNIFIHNTSTTEPIYNSDRPGGWFSEDLLLAFTQADWSNVCLAHLITAEAFTDNRLGVAFIASREANINGGICSPVIRNTGHPPSTSNVGVSSFLRGSRPLLLPEARLVLAHELGHNWGSGHDPTGGELSDCNPSLNEGGKFLMFPSVTDGQQDNNDVLSPCSLQSISDVLRAKTSCFVEVGDRPQLCGNYALDEEEKCDAGLDGTLNLDPCCDSSCQFRFPAVCSDVNEDCCSGCNFAVSSTPCKTYPAGSDSCLQNVTCSGLSGSCPSENGYVDIGTTCQGSGQCLPIDTQCNNSLPCNANFVNSTLDQEKLTCFNLCELQNMTKCFCEPLSNDECKLCCQAKVENSTCAPIGGGVLLVDGSTCLGGVCRVGNCEITTQDLASRLFNLFNTIDINSFIEFTSENIVGSVVFFVTLLWIPPFIIISIIDHRNWKDFSKAADQLEKQQCHLLAEDEMDRNQIDTIGLNHPNIHVDTFKAKKGLQKQHSMAESLYEDSFMLGGHYYLPAGEVPSPENSAMSKYRDEQDGPSLPSISKQKPDPERNDIRAFMKSGEVKGRSENRYNTQDSLSSQWTIV